MDEFSTSEELARRRELASFLKRRRDEVSPEEVGLPRRGRRRVAGLRRHEVADLAAVSVTWYTWLEQARDIRTTPEVIDSLCRALLIDADGRRYLRRLANLPITEPVRTSSPVDDGLRQLVRDFDLNPAHLMEPTGDLLAWNDAYARLYFDPLDLDPDRRNGVWIQVVCEPLRAHLVDWESSTDFAIARLRSEAGKYPADARFSALVDELKAESDFFRNAWERHEVSSFAGHTETIKHPKVGSIRSRAIQLRPLDHPRLTLMVHQLLDDESREGMRRLLADDGH